MTQNEYNALIEASKTNDAFLVCKNKKYWVCQNVGLLPFNETTLANYLQEEKNAYNKKLEALERRCEKQDAIIKELVEAIKTLNK